MSDTFLTTCDSFKCRWGTYCNDSDCLYIHPWQYGYHRAKYYQSTIPCKHETEETACRLKCGQKNGKYCPFLHCSHKNRFHLTITCVSFDCQGHCPDCL